MQATMKAAVYTRAEGITLQDVPCPKLQSEKDVIIKVELSTICGTDIHIQHGALPVDDGLIIGHEFVGEIVEVGSEVHKMHVGDHVAANCITSCGECYYCKHGYTNHCEHGGWIFGYKIDGCQAEYIRVPYADQTLFRIPEGVSYKDVLFVGDILSTGYFGAKRGEIQPGDTVVVIGGGPVGMCAMASARLFGAASIIAVDTIDSRLQAAVDNGVADVALNSRNVDVIEAVKKMTEGRGADVVIEAAGVKATFDLSWQVARPNAVVSIVALYSEAQELPLQTMAGKNLTIKSGWVDSVNMGELIQLIANKKLNMNFLATHEAPLNDILKGYEVFGKRQENCLKWVVTPYVK